MDNKKGFTAYEIVLLIAICIVIVAVFIECSVAKEYADTPMSEVPMWVWWLLK